LKAGDRALFWLTGKNGGIARVGFFIDKTATKPKTEAMDGHKWKTTQSWVLGALLSATVS